MKKLLFVFAALLFATGIASAQPLQLTNGQLDKVAAGFFEIDSSNTSLTIVSIFQRPYLLDSTPNTISCASCYLLIVTPTISVASQFAP